MGKPSKKTRIQPSVEPAGNAVSHWETNKEIRILVIGPTSSGKSMWIDSLVKARLQLPELGSASQADDFIRRTRFPFRDCTVSFIEVSGCAKGRRCWTDQEFDGIIFVVSGSEAVEAPFARRLLDDFLQDKAPTAPLVVLFCDKDGLDDSSKRYFESINYCNPIDRQDCNPKDDASNASAIAFIYDSLQRSNSTYESSDNDSFKNMNSW